MKQPLKRTLAVIAVFATAIIVLYRKSVRLYWTYDDPWFLHVALVRGWTEGFTHADIWRQNLFTPLLTSTYELFFATLWLEPRRWYVAQLVLLVGLTFAVYAALRLYVDVVPAAGAALLFIIGPPLANVAANLGVIHYVEALLFVTLSFIAFAKGRSVLSAVLYLVAILAKEIAVPLPLLLFLIAPREQRRKLIPHGIALVVYTAWRLLVIGLPVAGYGWAVRPSEMPGIVASAPWKVILAFGGTALAAGLVLLAVMAFPISRAIRTRRALLIAAAGLFLAIAPTLPVSKEMQRRYALMPWLWTCAGFGLGVATMKRREAVIAAAVLVAVVANRQEWSVEYTRSKRMSEEARVWLHEKGDILLRNPAIPPGTMPELQWLKEDYFHFAAGARWFYDDIFLCTHRLEGRRILEWEPKSRAVTQSPVDPNRVCGAVKNNAPMTADFRRSGDALLWEFGPYATGTWRLVLANGEHAWDVPRDSAYRLGETRKLDLRIAYRSPEGWVSYSPEINLDFTRQTRVTWRR